MPDFGSSLATERNERALAGSCYAHKSYEHIGWTMKVSITLSWIIELVYRAALPSRKIIGLVDRLDWLLPLRLKWSTISNQSTHWIRKLDTIYMLKRLTPKDQTSLCSGFHDDLEKNQTFCCSN